MATPATIPWTIHVFAVVEEPNDAVEEEEDDEHGAMTQTKRRI